MAYAAVPLKQPVVSLEKLSQLNIACCECGLPRIRRVATLHLVTCHLSVSGQHPAGAFVLLCQPESLPSPDLLRSSLSSVGSVHFFHVHSQQVGQWPRGAKGNDCLPSICCGPFGNRVACTRLNGVPVVAPFWSSLSSGTGGTDMSSFQAVSEQSSTRRL